MSVYTHAQNSSKFTYTNYDKTHHSSAQSKFSFSKADRFPRIQNFSPPVAGYDVTSQLGKRSASIGYGDKNIFKAVERKRGKSTQIFTQHPSHMYFLWL